MCIWPIFMCTSLWSEVLQSQARLKSPWYQVAAWLVWAAWIACLIFHVWDQPLPSFSFHWWPSTDTQTTPRNKSQKSKILLIHLYFKSQQNVTCSRWCRFPKCQRGFSYLDSFIRLLKQTKPPRAYVYKSKQKTLTFILSLITFLLNLMLSIWQDLRCF